MNTLCGLPLTADELVREIQAFRRSARRKSMLDGARYYAGDHDILRRKRLVIGEKGELTPSPHLPNHRLADNLFGRAVDQKSGYLWGREPAFFSDNPDYPRLLGRLLPSLLLRLGTEALTEGIVWVYPEIEPQNRKIPIRFRVFPGHEILPFWRDRGHTKLQAAVRIYNLEGTAQSGCEIYTPDGVILFDMRTKQSRFAPYMTANDKNYAFADKKIPLIPFRANPLEQPLLERVRSLQDALNLTLSDFQNTMEEDARNTLLVLKNYDGECLSEFRKNLTAYGAVKVKSAEGGEGDVKVLNRPSSHTHFVSLLDTLRKALLRGVCGFDGQDARLLGSPNQLHIRSMFLELDLDANTQEREFQYALASLRPFWDTAFFHAGLGDFSNTSLTMTANRDQLMDEAGIMQTLYAGGLKLSNQSLLEQVPWVTDVEREMERLRETA